MIEARNRFGGLALTAFFTMLAAATTSASAEPGTKMLYLVRHGQYDHEDERDADIGKALIPLGVAQARLLANRLRSLPVEMSVLHSSTMTRARETAAVVHEEMPWLERQKTKILRECTPTTRREDIMERLEPGEAAECEEQLEEAFAEYFVPSPNGDSHEIVVCHGNVIRYFVTRVLGVDPESWLQMSIGNCSLTVIRINPDNTFKLLTFADVGHLPTNLLTGWERVDRSLVIPKE